MSQSAYSHTICPHWEELPRSCSLSLGGLYIPVASHVDAYCTTGNYQTCAQYQRVALQKAMGQEAAAENRRRFIRVPGRYQLRLTELLHDEEMEGLIDDSAITVDLSPGGLRLESHRPMPIDSLVSFHLNGDFSASAVHGSGLVKWCRPLEHSPLYQAGIVFTDTLAANAIRRQLAV